MSPHDVVLVVGLGLAALAQLLIYLFETTPKPRRPERREAARVRTSS